MSENNIRPATEQDLEWLRNGPDPNLAEKQARHEVEKALTATGTPSHWHPVEIDETLLR